MDHVKLFATPLWREDLRASSPDWRDRRQAMLDRIYALAKSGKGVEKTNFGGWQSTDDLFRHPEFAWLLEQITALGNSVATEFAPDRTFNDGHMWANINRRGDFNAVHTHPESLLSGVIYLKVESESQGVIEFFDAREGSPTSHWACFTQLPGETDTTRSVYSVTPQEGRILFFPGWLKHWVTPNMTDEDRVSVSFNMSMR